MRAFATANGPMSAYYSCKKCPGYCCSYPLIEITKRDVARLARHFDLDYETAEKRFTKYDKGEKSLALRHKKDRIFKTVCQFFDTKKRHCTVYEARPGVCREFPTTKRCGYYEFLKFERQQQDDPKWIALT
ncbi:MAG: YkgJ family cysteine cluster protein [Burkholderiales bacterium]